jgi:GDP-L-fucose synthase
VGYGRDITIQDLATKVARGIGFEGSITRDLGKPDGMPRKLMDSSLINALGWSAATPLDEGIAKTYAWYLDNVL